MNTADILDKAADLIEQRGWAQGYFVDHRGGLCARGAIYAACGMEPDPDPHVRIVEWPGWNPADPAWDALCQLDTAVDDFAEMWNDAPERTKEEVVSALRAAAQAARESDG